MLKRAFELLQLDLGLLTICDAVRMADDTCNFTFTYAQSLMWNRVRKRNTIFFEVLTDLLGTPYDLTDVRTDFLYDAVFVDMNTIKDNDTTFVLRSRDSADGLLEIDNRRLKQALYHNGFTIEGVPMRRRDTLRPSLAEAEGVENIHYVAFLSSASMARKGLVLFVNEALYDGLIRRLSLDLFRYDQATHRLRMPTADTPNGNGLFFRPDFKVPAAKYSAYMGLMLSDGVSLKEKSCIWKETCGTAPVLPELNAESVFVVRDMEIPAAPYYEALGDHAWVIEAEDTLPAADKAKKSQLYKRFFAALGPSEAEAIDHWSARVQHFLTHASFEDLPTGDRLPAVITDDCSALQWALALLCRLDGKQGRDPDLPLSEALAQMFDRLPSEEAARNTLHNLMGCGDTFRIDGEEGAIVYWKDRPLCLTFENSSSRVFTARLKKSSDLTQKLNLFDGMGLCDPETFERLEQLLTGKEMPDKDHRISAVILRLPWIKGVLVKCDFHRFFSDKAAEQGIDLKGRTMQDLFDCDRDLSKIHIILSQSMVKGEKHLRNLQQKAADGHSKNVADPWAYYWEMIEKYNIPMLITGKNSKESVKERMNFQFLSTSGLGDETAERLCRDAARSILDDLPEADPEDDPEAEAEETPEAIPEIEPEAIRNFEDLLNFADAETAEKLRGTWYVRTASESNVRSHLLDGMLGRLPVHGDFRLIAPDLLSMLYYLYDSLILGEKEPQLKGALNRTDRSGTGHGCFYAPSGTDVFRGEIACLRNPHLALGETAILSPLPDADRTEYDRYFAHLDSIIMLPAAAVGTMGGADFDGDRCLCLADPGILGDIKAVIEENKAHLRYMMAHRNDFDALLDDCAASDSRTLTEQAQALKAWLADRRVLPEGEDPFFRPDLCPPLIFGAEVKGAESIQFGCNSISFEEKLYTSFVLTAEQRIGILSLKALDYAGKAYPVGDPADAAWDHLRAWLWHWRMVSLSLETGAEIDMAKTGIRCQPAKLRENKPVSEKVPAPHRQPIYDLFDCPLNLLGLFRKQEEENDHAIRQQRGKEFAQTLHRFVQPAFETDLLHSPHNNVALIPYRMYSAMQTCMNGHPSPDTPLPLEEGKGTNLRTVIFRLLGMTSVKRDKQILQPTDNEEPTVFQNIRDRNPVSMEDLVWAADADRPAVVANYINHYMEDRQKLTTVDLPGVTDAEPGIYFLKEIAKFLHYSRLKKISDDDGEGYMTPDALAEGLKKLWGGDTDGRLAYLCTYKERYFDEIRGKKRLVVDDHLFLALVGGDLAEICKPHMEKGEIILDSDICRKADRLLREYVRGKHRRAAHAALQHSLEERHRQSMRNLQRRRSLAEAIGILRAYSGGYEETPLGRLGLPPEKLYHLFTHMEEVKED